MIVTRPATKEDFEDENFLPLNVVNQQGVGPGERFVLKNLAANPSRAKSYLKGLGYDVRDLPQDKRRFLKWNFAVRKSPDEFWKVVDPDGFDLQDFSDLVADGLVGVASGLGFTAGGALGAGAGAAAGELLRQSAGSAAGIEDNLSGFQVGAAGVGGAISPAISKGVGMAARGLGRIASGLGARLVNAKALPGLNLSQTDVFLQRAASKAPLGSRLPSISETATRIVNSFKLIRDHVPPEGVLARQMEREATKGGVTASGTRMMAFLRNARASEVARSQGTLAKDLEKVERLVYDAIQEEVRRGPVDIRNIPLRSAVRIKSLLQDMARSKGAYSLASGQEIKLSAQLVRRLEKAAAAMRVEILRKMRPAAPEYAPVMKALEDRMNDLRNFEFNFKIPGSKRDTDELLVERVANRIKAMVGSDSREGAWEFLQGWEQRFGIEGLLSGDIRAAAIGTAIGDQGMTTLTPQFTATGGILGASVFGLSGSVPGSLLLGGVLASPRTLLGAAKVGQLASNAASRVASSAPGQATGLTTQQAMLQAFRQAAAQVDTSGKATMRERAPSRRQVLR